MMPENYRILYFSTQFPTVRNPSMGVFSLQRVLALRRAGCEVLVVSPLLLNPPPELVSKPKQAYWWFKRQSQQPFEMKYQDLSVYYPKWICPPKKIFGWTMGYFLYLQMRNIVQNLTESFRPDLLLSSWLPDGVTASKLGRLLNIPVLAIADGSDVNIWPEKYRGWNYARNILNENIFSIIFVSHALQDKGISNGLHSKRNIVLHNAVDVQQFKPGDLKHEDNLFTILGIGRLLSNKGFHVLLFAFAEFVSTSNTQARLILVGEGPQRNALCQQAQELDILSSVEFVDPIEPQELVKYYQKADVFCLPSFNEGFPCVVVEAMACGKPVVASRVGGIAEVVDEQSGILVEPGDTKALCEALLKAKDREWDSEIIRKKIVDNFSFEKWTDKIIRLMGTATR